MHNRLYRELNEFLIQYDISADTHIFEEVLMQFTEIPVKEGKSSYSFSRSWGSETELRLSTPSLSLPKLTQVLDYFKVPNENYKTNKDIPLNTEVLFNEILPQFKNHVDLLARTKPEELKPYQIASKKKLERKAIDEIESLIDKILNFLNKDEVIPLANKQLSKLLFQIQGMLKNIQSDSKYYFYIANAYADLKSFLEENLELKNSIDIQNLNDLHHQLEIYIKYNRAESVLAINRVMNELNSLLLPYFIDKNECDIFEHYLLELAGVKQYPTSSKYKGGYSDKTKMNFIMLGLIEEDASKFLTWVKANGDEGATLSIQVVEASDAMKSNKMRPQSAEVKETHTYVTRYVYEIDGEALHKKILPLFKEKLLSIVSQDISQLRPYQDRSENSEILNKFLSEQHVEKLSVKNFNENTGFKLFDQNNITKVENPIIGVEFKLKNT